MRICLLFCLTLLIGNTFAKENSNVKQHKSIEVFGAGSIQSVPDRFSFSLSIEEKGKVAAHLNQAIIEKSNSVIQALFEIGVDKQQVQSLQIRFNPWIEYKNNTQEQKGFILTRQITVTLDSLTKYEQSIDAVLNLGVSHINQFSFSNSQADKHYQAALQQALINAQQRATDMAKVLGLKLSGVISILEQTSGQPAPIMAKARQFQASESYQAGEMLTEGRVKVVFALQNASK